MGICYTRVNTEVVYHSFHSENCKYLLVLEEKLHSRPKYFLTSQKLCKRGLGLRLVLWPHILLYIMIVFLKIRACSIARKCVWQPVTVTVCSAPAPVQVCFCSTWCSGFADLMVLELMWNSVAVGSWRFCFSQKNVRQVVCKGHFK